jgi:hypothetical protein
MTGALDSRSRVVWTVHVSGRSCNLTARGLCTVSNSKTLLFTSVLLLIVN